jgi:hypothetical protein
MVVGIDIEILDILGVNDKLKEGEWLKEKSVVVGIETEILDILGVNDKLKEGEWAGKQAMVLDINIEILDILGVNDKVGEERGLRNRLWLWALLLRSWTSLDSVIK